MKTLLLVSSLVVSVGVIAGGQVPAVSRAATAAPSASGLTIAPAAPAAAIAGMPTGPAPMAMSSMTVLPAMAAIPGDVVVWDTPMAYAPGLTYRLPPAPRNSFATEPADSLYRLARAALNDGDFRKASQLFQTVVDRYPDSEFAPDALYWRAYALFRGASGSRDLDLAMQALDRQVSRYPKAGTLSDANQLRASIRAEQARRGSGEAFNKLQEDANKLNQEKGCPTADDDSRIIALRGIQQLDPDQVLPVLQKLLARTDDCSVKLRQNALYMVAQTKEEERSDILLRVASADPNSNVRRDAVRWLAEVNTERAAKALDSILFNATDPDMRERALQALAQHRSTSARTSLRKFAEQTNVPTDLRARAVINIATSPRKLGDENEYLHGLFNKTASPELREAIIEGVSQIKAPDRTAWLLGIARDKKQETEVRRKALYAAGQGGIELKDVLNLYDEMNGQVEMQDQLLYVYRQRREPEATDKLMQIAKTEKNPELRRKAISYLADRKDPRVRQFLLDIVNP
jgi:HEAT repeat protein